MPSSQDKKESWKNHASCLGQDIHLFFPSHSAGVRVARQFCAGCIVQEACLEYALQEQIEHGIWGGASERERMSILKSRRK